MYKWGGKRPKRFNYDLVILGTGSGGGVAAHNANKAGKKVAVIEADTIGGECPNFGCVPTKALLQAAESYRIATDSKQFGITASNVTYNYAAIKAWKDLAVHRTGATEGAEFFEEEGIRVIKGEAHFLSPWVVSVRGRRLSAKHFLIATGTHSVVPPIPGLKEAGFMTYRQAIDITKLPKSLFVIGGGAIGCEFAHLFNSFGAKVHIADCTPRLIPAEEPEAGELLGALFEQRDMAVHLMAKVTRVEVHNQQKVVFFEKDSQTHHVTVDEIMIASGKAPNTDIGLENAGVKYNRGGVLVNKYMQTTAKHIYAAGDIVGPYRFTHTAAYQSRIACHNMFHNEGKVVADYHAVPRCVFVDPEIASVGATEAQLGAQGIRYQIGAVPISVIGRSNTTNQDTGFVKVIAAENGTLLGACIVSPRAGEMIHELTLAVQKRLKAQDIAGTIHAFPTWSEAVRLACQKIKS